MFQDEDGRVTAKQLKKMMQTLGNAITDEEVADIMKEARVDRGGSISFAEFSRLMGVGIKHTVEADPEEDMRHAFRLFDQDKDGFISWPEFLLLTTLLSISPMQLKMAFRMFDKDNNGVRSLVATQ